MRYKVVHRTEYVYSEPVRLCHNEARLRPRTTFNQSCERSEVVIDPAPAVVHDREDIFGNRVLYFAIQETHQRLVVTSTSEVERWRPALAGRDTTPAWEEVRRSLREASDLETRLAQDFVLESPSVEIAPGVVDYAQPSFAPGRPMLECVLDLSARIHREFKFDPTRTTVKTHISEVLTHRGGVCQDFAHLAIGCLRSLGLAARYMSGYLETMPPPGQARLEGADASHAWLAAFIPGIGWFEVDPTNDQEPDDRYVTIGWGRDYTDVTPFKGVLFGGGKHELEVGVDMVRIDPVG